MRTVSLTCLLGVLLLTDIGFQPTGRNAAAAPPVPAPPEFALPQSTTLPAPFPIKHIDQGTFDPKLKGIYLPEGFKAEIVIDAPDTINPVGMTFDPDGNLYVMEWRPDPVTRDKWFEVKETFRYRDGTTRQVATMKKFTTDLIKQFKYNPDTGKFEKPTIIISEELPSSILWHEGYLYVTGRGTVRRWKQSRANGPWNERDIIAQGFCGFHHHQVSGLTIGNDGLLYITSGDDDNFVEGSDGSRATVLRTGAIFRCRPDGSNMEVFSIGYRNPYRDIAYDDKFNFFHTDNDNEDGSKFMGCRIMHVAEGTDFGWRLQLGARCCRPDHTRGAIAGELPGKVAPLLKTGRGAPAGLLIYHDTRVPEQYRGLLYYPDVFRKLVRAYSIAPNGSTFKATHEFEFMKSDDPLFRPCQMITGPDGAIYVCDWRTNSGGAGKLSGDGINGRIYRITWNGTKNSPALPRRAMDSWARIRKQSDEELLKSLGAPDLTDRVEARKELVRRGEAARELVLKKFISGTLAPEARLLALGVLTASWNKDVKELFCLLINDEAPEIRRHAVGTLALHGKSDDNRVYDTLVKALADQEPAVRRAAALGLGRLGTGGSGEILVNALRHDSEADAYLKDAYIRGLERLGKPGIAAVVDLAQSGNDKDKDLAVEIFLALRTTPGADRLPEILLHPHVTTEQRVALVRSYTNYQTDPPITLDPLADYFARRPNEPVEVLLAGLDVFAASGEAAAPKATQLVLKLLERPDEEVRMAAIAAIEANRLAAAAPSLIEFMADTERKQAERVAAARALGVLGDKRAIDSLKEVMERKSPALLKAAALRSLATLDISAARKAAEAALDQPDRTLLSEAVAVLATTKPGARLVAERYLAKKLPQDFFPQVNEAINKFPEDASLAKLRADVLRGGLLLSLESSQVDKIRQEVNKKGDPQKGKELYLNTKLLACASCHRMEGVGGATGPDLTRLWDTMSVEKILEAIIDPSKEIKEGYQSYRVVTIDGKVIIGLKVKEDRDEVVIRDSTGRDNRVLKDDIESLSVSKVSLMPDNVVSMIRYEQFIDLLAFLKSKQEQESLRGLVVDTYVAATTSPDMQSAKPETLSEKKWSLLSAEPNARLDLKAAFETPQTQAVYVRAYVHSPRQQSVQLVISSDNPWRAWINQTIVGQGSDETVEIKEGWNEILVKVANGGKPPELGIRVNGEGLRTASRPDTLAVGNQ